MSLTTSTNCRTGTTRPVYTVESLQTLKIDSEKLPTLTDEMKVIAEGLAQKLNIEGENLNQFITEFCYLSDIKWKRTARNGKPKGKSKEEKDALKQLRADFDASILLNEKNEFSETAEGWARVEGNYGEIYFDAPKYEPDGKKKIPYEYDFDAAVAKATELGCESITKTKYGYSIRTSTIPIKVGTKKGSTELSHPERSIAYWVKLSEFPLKHSRTEPVANRSIASKFELENKTQECIYMAEKMRNSMSPSPEPKKYPIKKKEDETKEETTEKEKIFIKPKPKKKS